MTNMRYALEGPGVQNPRPREILRAEGVYCPMHPDSRQCMPYGHSLRISSEVLIFIGPRFPWGLIYGSGSL